MYNTFSRRRFLGSLGLLGASGPLAMAYEPGERNFVIGVQMSSLVGAGARDAQIGLSMMLEEVASQLNWSITVERYDEGESLRNDLRQGKIDIALGSPTQLLQHFDIEEPDRVYLFHLNGKPTRRFSVISRAADRYITLHSLANRKIAMPVNTDLGAIFVETELARRGLPALEEHFGGVDVVDSYEDAVNRVFFGQAECAIVTPSAHRVYADLNPQVFTKIRVIAESDEMVTAMMFPSTKNVKRMQECEDMMLTMHERPRGRSLLKLFGCDHLAKGKLEMLDSVRRLLHDHRTLRAS